MEMETKIFFDLQYFEDKMKSGQWDDADKYLCAFVSPTSTNKVVSKVFFELRKYKYYDLLLT
jgi:hypothetical protein